MRDSLAYRFNKMYLSIVVPFLNIVLTFPHLGYSLRFYGYRIQKSLCKFWWTIKFWQQITVVQFERIQGTVKNGVNISRRRKKNKSTTKRGNFKSGLSKALGKNKAAH